MRVWSECGWGRAVVAGCVFLACGAEDSGGDAMAEEIGGECVFTPGSYVVNYSILDTNDFCEDLEAPPDEYLTVLSDGRISGENVAPEGCVDSQPQVDGCYVAFNRSCEIPVTTGTGRASSRFEYDYADGSGVVSFSIQIYSGPTLIASCTANVEATIRRR